MTKALLKVGGACNEKCVFCHATPTREHDATTEEIFAKIDLAAARGFEMVVFSGGEPTIRPDLGRLVDRVGRHGLSLGFITNGRRFAYPKFADGLFARGLSYVYLSLHGGDRETQDRAVRAESFDEAVRGLSNLVGRGAWITVNCVVTRLNVDRLGALVDLVVPKGVRLKLSFVQPKGDALLRVDRLTPRMTEAADAIRAAFARARRIRADADLAFDGLPICLLEGEADRFDDLRTNGILAMSESMEDRYHPVDTRDWVKTQRCDDCRHRGTCPGVHREYHARWGDSEVCAVRGPRANAFDFVLGQGIEGAPGPHCPALSRAEPPEGRARTLYVAGAGSLRLATTRTRDFADDAIAAVRAGGQVWIDRSTGPAPTAFRRDLGPLRPSPACASCPRASECPGAWEAYDADPFGDAERSMQSFLGTLQGRVLDVGCGAVPYADALRRPDVAYLGVDPDASSDLPVVRAPVEDFPIEGRSFDHLLLLRSWNHLEDPRAVVERLLGAVRTGGTVALADDVPFALVRSPAQIAARDAAEPGLRLEHHHLDDADRALARLAGLPLAVR